MPPGSRTSDYAFELPGELVAQHPPATRGTSRLMVLHRDSGNIEHRAFGDLPEYIAPGDLVVRNTTRVLRARLLGTRDSGAPAEVLLLARRAPHVWEAMVRPGGKVRPGRTIHVATGLDVRVLEITERRTRVVELVTDLDDDEAIERFGHIPLPPYIARRDEAGDAERYQTVYARERGSVAAPTAGLHFTPEVLDAIVDRGARIADVVLHVGAGTFKPVETDDPAEHVMHEESYIVPEETARAVEATRASGGRVLAIGTTTVRTLESAADTDGRVAPGRGDTSIFIRPPYTFRAIDALLTNFHLPHSTLLMLVAAFAGFDATMHAYRTAVAERYRFFSYGDAMLIL